MKAVIFTIFLIATTYAAFRKDAKKIVPPKINADTIGELILGGSKAEKDQGKLDLLKKFTQWSITPKGIADRAQLNQKITDLANKMEKCVDDFVKKHRGNETLYTDLNVYIRARPNTNPSGFNKQVRVYAWIKSWRKS